jgi:hypothetical protein
MPVRLSEDEIIARFFAPLAGGSEPLPIDQEFRPAVPELLLEQRPFGQQSRSGQIEKKGSKKRDRSKKEQGEKGQRLAGAMS